MILALLSSACAGEAIVSYKGSVVAAEVAGHGFDTVRNPRSLPPIAGAEIALLVCDGRCRGGEGFRTVRSGPAGEWGPLDRIFGGLGASHEIQVRVEAPGYARYTYSAVYETTGDPSGGEAYLNIALAPDSP